MATTTESESGYNATAKIATDEFAVRGDLLSTVKLMYNTYIRGKTGSDGNNQALPASLAALATLRPETNIVPETTTVDDGLFINVLDRERFRAVFSGSDTSKYAAADINAGIFWYDGATASNADDSTMVKYSPLAQSTDVSANTSPTSDVNAYNLMVKAGFSALANQLRDLKIAYQLLDDDIFQNLTSTTDVDGALSSLPNIGYYRIYDVQLKPAPTSGQWRSKVVNEPTDYTPDEVAADKAAFASSVSIVNFVRTLDPTVQDIFVIRRMILCTFLAANFNFFFNIFYFKKQANLGSNVDATFAAKIAFYFYQKLQRLNTTHESNLINPTVNDVSKTVQDVMTENVKQYTANTSRLSYLSTDISEKKRFLTNEVGRINAEKTGAAYASKLKIIAVSFAVIFAVALIVIMMLPFETKLRVKIAGGIAILVVILAIIMSVLVRRVEGFENAPLNTPAGAASQAMTATSVAEYEKLVSLLMMEEMRNFYRNTIDIAMNLQNNRLYSELNYNSGKERNYFENSQYQLNKSVSDARNAQRLFDRDTKISTAVIRLFLQLLVIVAFVLLGVMSIQDTMPGLRPFIFTIGAILAVLAFIIFFGEILGRTRIDADKMYWGTPNAVDSL